MVLVGDAEPVVRPLRDALDPTARLGVPAHVSVLFPFMAPDVIDHDVREALMRACQRVAVHRQEFVGTRWFGDDVLWLAPASDTLFRTLTREIWTAFPEYPPYGGQFDEIVPHLTVADRAPREAMQQAECAIQPHLPIKSTVDEVTLLIEQPSGRWTAECSFPLAR